MNFDKKANDWDNDPVKEERSSAFALEIKKFLADTEVNDALEYGCGTGLLSFFLKDRFKRITLADSSEGMLMEAQKKIRENNLDHFRTLRIDLEKKELHEKFDVVYTLMTLHHIVDLDFIFHRFSNIIAEGGFLCIGDLEKEDGSFHSNMPEFDGHNGFERDKLERLLTIHGFSVLKFKDFFTIVKEKENEKRSYPLFLLFAQKPSFSGK
jgi:predicted TPR repeat methyltransferase